MFIALGVVVVLGFMFVSIYNGLIKLNLASGVESVKNDEEVQKGVLEFMDYVNLESKCQLLRIVLRLKRKFN